MTGRGRTPGTGRLLVVAPSRRSRGGIAVAAGCLLESAALNGRRVCWLETMDDRSTIRKLLSFAVALLRFPAVLAGADLVHVHTSSGTSFWRKSLFITAAALVGKKVIVQIHPTHFIDFFAGRGRVGRRLIAAILSRAAAVVVLSAAVAGSLRQQMTIRRLLVLPNPCPYPVVDETAWQPRRPDILFAGKLMAAKGCHELLEAFARVQGQFPAARLIMAGNGEVEYFRTRAAETGLRDRVIFPGWLTGEALLTAYREAAIFCLPSHSEGLPMSLLEAMSQGAAAVVTPVGGIPEVIVHDENGVLVPAGDGGALAAALLRLLGDEATVERLARTAMATIRHRYSREEIGCRLETIYREIEAG